MSASVSASVTRRRFFGLGAAALGVAALPLHAEGGPALQVFKDPSCGCCGAWVEIMEQAGFAASVENVDTDVLWQIKAKVGVSDDLASCHTALLEGYAVEGHVPAADLRRLLDERPDDVVGLSVPGMPMGAPGMGPEDAREAYDVIAFLKDGTTRVWASYAAA